MDARLSFFGLHVNPLSIAMVSGHMEVVKLLIRAGATPDLAGVLAKSDDAAFLQKCEMLLDGSPRDAKSTSAGGDLATLLRIACDKGFVVSVKALVEKGADVDAVGEDGSTPLEAACRAGSVKVVRELVCSGGAAGRTAALCTAAAHHRREVCPCLNCVA